MYFLDICPFISNDCVAKCLGSSRRIKIIVKTVSAICRHQDEDNT